MTEDHGIENLLDLDGTIIQQEFDCWVKIEAKRVDVTPARPKGVKYSLTLHSEDGKRILGFDNAHQISNGLTGYNHRWLIEYDHEHTIKEEMWPYDYRDAEKLLVDFWTKVDEAIATLGE